MTRRLIASLCLAVAGIAAAVVFAQSRPVVTATPLALAPVLSPTFAEDSPLGFAAYQEAIRAGRPATVQPTYQDVYFAEQAVIAGDRDDNLHVVTGPDRVIADAAYYGYAGRGLNGRGLLLINAPRASLWNLTFNPGNDDSCCIVGDCRGTVISHCIFPVTYPAPNTQSKALICYTHPSASNRQGPIYGAADGYAATFNHCDFRGGNVRMVGGVWQFNHCKFSIGALYAIEAMDAKINLVNCDFYTLPKPANWGYWHQRGVDGLPDPCGIRVTALVDGKQAASPINSRLYIANCRLDGKSIDGPSLCRRFPNAADVRAGFTSYAGKGSVPATVFLKTPNG